MNCNVYVVTCPFCFDPRTKVAPPSDDGTLMAALTVRDDDRISTVYDAEFRVLILKFYVGLVLLGFVILEYDTFTFVFPLIADDTLNAIVFPTNMH